MGYENTLAGLTGIVTGAGSGIGREIALLAAERGARVFGFDISAAGLAETSLLSSAEIGIIECDVSDPASVDDAVGQVLAEAGRIDFLVNGAGIEDSGATIVDTTVEHWDRLMSVNLRGIFLLMRRVLPGMYAQGSGSIVNMGSVASLTGWAELATYTASKHAVIGLTRSAVAESARFGVRVNAICPGPTQTPLQDRAEEKAPDPVEFRRRQEEAIPQGRYGDPREIAQAVAFLVSDQSEYVNGAALAIDGGMTATG